MALIDAVLSYTPMGGGGTVPLGKTDDPRVLRAVRDRLLEEAADEARMWRDLDPGTWAIRAGELERLSVTLGFLLPDEDLGPRICRTRSSWRGTNSKNPGSWPSGGPTGERWSGRRKRRGGSCSGAAAATCSRPTTPRRSRSWDSFRGRGWGS